MLNENRVLDIIFAELRRIDVRRPDPLSREMRAYREAARRISQEAMSEQRQAARTASLAGFVVTRGRTRL